MSWTKKVAAPSEVVDKGQKVRAVVLSVHPDKKRIALGLKQLTLDPWQKEILERYSSETEHPGVVTKVTNFGIFVELEDDLEGLLHISELTPADHLEAGAKVGVRVLRLDTEDRKIALTLIRDPEALERLGVGEDEEPAESEPAAEEAKAEEPSKAEEPAVEEPAEAKAEEAPKADAEEAPKADAEEAPKAEEPAAEEAPAEEPSAGEPASEEPTAEEEPKAEAEEPAKDEGEAKEEAEAKPEA
jgi:small subunit ribosomal protein S1